MAEIDRSKDLYICCAECIIEKDGKILVIRRPSGVHAGGLFAFPGGKIEYSDGAGGKNIFAEAAKREVLEEVGIKIEDPIRLITSSFFFDDLNGLPVIDCVFFCHADKTQTIVNANEREVPEYYWLSREEIFSHQNSPEWVKRYVSLTELKGSQK